MPDPRSRSNKSSVCGSGGEQGLGQGSGQALGSLTGDAGWESPSSALTQSQRCCRSSEMSTEQGAFDT